MMRSFGHLGIRVPRWRHARNWGSTRELSAEQHMRSPPRRLYRVSTRKQLRFLRDYGEIRPWSHHCLERIVRIPFEAMMRLAVEEARQSRRERNKGYGAVAVRGRRVLTRTHDTAVFQKEPSLHAEVNAIRQATRVLNDDNLSDIILFSACEPCPMCSSLAVWVNLSAIVFGASIEQTAAKGKSRILVPAREIMKRSPVTIEILQGMLEQECLSLY